MPFKKYSKQITRSRITNTKHDLQEIGEFGLINRIRKRVTSSDPALVQGIGDDVAVIATGLTALLVTTDILIEDIHFDLSWTDPYTLGRKSLAVNLSDIASTGGTPKYFLISLGLPKNLPHLRHPGVVLYLKDRATHLVSSQEFLLQGLGVLDHGPELKAVKGSAVVTDPLLPEKDRPGAIALDRDRDRRQQRRDQEQDRRAQQPIFDLLPDAEALMRTTDAIKEMIGLIAYRIAGWA